MTNVELKQIIDNISYKPGWTILLNTIERPFIQLSVDETSDATLDSVKRDGTRIAWKSGKRYISQFMCRQEIVGLVFALIKDAELHEVHEWFRYRDTSIYNPHLDPDILVDVASKKESFCVREDSMTLS